MKIRETKSSKYISAYKGQMLKSGNWIRTGNGVFLSIIFLDGTNVKIHQKTEVEIGIRNEGNLEILKGLNEGDKIIAEGLTKIRPGMKVKPIVKSQ